MRIVLHPDLRLQGRVLHDTRIDVRYTVTADTKWLLRQLLQARELDEIVATTVTAKHVDVSEAKQAVYALLGYLDTLGAVRIIWHGWLGALPLRLRWHYRYPPSYKGFCGAVWQAYGLLAIVMSVAMFGLYAYTTGVPSVLLWLPSIFLFSCVVHEFGHIAAVRLYRIPYMLLARVGYAAVVYARPVGIRSCYIALSGPLCAFTLYSCAALLSEPAFLRVGLWTTSIVHLCNLLPFFADGKTIWRINE